MVLNRSTPPIIHNAVEFDLKLPSIRVSYLDNGVPVYQVHAGVEDVLQLDFVFNAGNFKESANMIAVTTNHLLKNGTKTREAFAISEQIDFYGGFLSRSCQFETASMTLHTLSKHLPVLLPVVTDIFTESIFPQEELDVFVQNTRSKLSVNLLKCDFIANRNIDVALYGFDHPYGKYTRVEDLESLTRESLTAFYDAHYRQGELAIYVAGKLPSDIEEQLNAAFGSLPFTNNRPVANPPILLGQSPQDRVIRTLNDPNGVQGAIRLARHFPNRHHPDFQKAQVLNNVFGGFFGSRLMANIREDKGYTYGIHSFIQNHTLQTSWMVSTEAGRDVVEAAIKEVYHEMKQLRTELVDEEELLLVKNYMIGGMLSSLDGPFQIMGRWKNYVKHGVADPMAYFQEGLHAIKSCTAEELLQLADKYLQPDDFYDMVVV